MIQGYDVSNVNGPNLVIPGDAEFVIAKVSQDSKFVDRLFTTHRATARQREIGFGGYHYGDNKAQPDAEASCDMFLLNLGDQQEGEVAALDIEGDFGYGGFDPHKSTNQPWVRAWGRKFARERNYKCKLYTSVAGLSDYDLIHPEMAEVFDLWLAYWTNSGQPSAPPVAPAPFDEYKLWQYNADTIDKNVFLGTLEEFRATGKQIAPSPTLGVDYEALYYGPITKLINDMAASSQFPHADAALHATISNSLTLHKIGVGAELPI